MKIHFWCQNSWYFESQNSAIWSYILRNTGQLKRKLLKLEKFFKF